MKVIGQHIDKLISEVFLIEIEEAKEAGAIGYMARAMVQATMPHSKVERNEFSRTNGLFTLTILASSKVGLPYGTIPRLLLAWVATEAVKTKSKNLILGRTLSQFMEELGLMPTGGRWGSITRLKDQMTRFFSASISCTYDDGVRWAIQNVNPVSQANLWWSPKQPDQETLFDSTLTLTEDFFNEITTRPVPIDMRALKALKRSPLAIDIYCWLTYRMSYLRKPTYIPWEVLKIQFGADYAISSQGTRDFKKAFLRELRKVVVFYKKANLGISSDGLTLSQGSTHISKKESL